ncbi:hypothetical protein HDU92_007160 [Lobulomyces angularis]|nr:hypothetical protein HDU92_007160 [Lobulomyces angularis]
MQPNHYIADDEFENGLNLLRTVFNNKISIRETQIRSLKLELHKKTEECKSFSQKYTDMELRCVEQERQLRDNSNIINRLTNFKKSVLESFGEDDFRDVFNSKMLTSQHSNNESSQLNIYGQKAQKCENEFFSDDYKKLQYLTEEKNRIIGYSPNSAEMLPSKPLQLEKKNNINTQISNNVNSEYHSKKQVEQLKMNLMENELHKINLDTIQNENSNLENKTTLHVDGRGFLKAAKNALTFDEV